ncbi:ABSCISIC ACID-INSENSITIVE 5-like protein 1 [Mangifera indica]|uniref:ABSCISIC ACID-INSENSITIVE 5-like protein 1 n=1 Tax=Mangifera indica TaxID=29780 RepID=UPI001CFBF36E|nr:ABSCISIC ACID-INSENSITIVE 5-like protein 1 [Mangifera indica]
MALAESTPVAYGVHQLEPVQHQSQQEEPINGDSSASPLNKQSSIFSLTLDEIQLKSGKSFGSMNMDEFLINLWNFGENNNQVTSSSKPKQTEPNDNNNDNNKMLVENQPTLTRQNSFSIPIQLCKKTVEEVWSEIQGDNPSHLKITDHEPPQRQQTLGEMTLEEFLIKAGVVREAVAAAVRPSNSNTIDHHQPNMVAPPTMQSSNANFGMGPMMALGYSSHQNMGSNLLMNNYITYPIYTPSNNTENEKSHGMGVENGLKSHKKRIIDGPPEVVVERRQRRMIKNRESAARSRARKQAYRVELELELNQLREENEKLKQIVKEYEVQRLQEILKRVKASRKARRKGENLRRMKRSASATW